MSGASGATRCVSSNDGAYCAAGTANIGSCASSHQISGGCVQSSRRWHVASAKGKGSLSIAAYQQVTSTIMSRQRERQRHSSRRPRPNNANPSVPTGRSTTDIFFI